MSKDIYGSVEAETKVFPGPILILVRGVVERGASVKIEGNEIEVNPDGTFAGHAFVSPGHQEVTIEAEMNGSVKKIRRHFSVTD